MRALCAFINLMRAAESVDDRSAAHLAAAKLTRTQFGALEALYHCGPMSQCDLAAKLLRSGADVTVVVDNLEKRGLASRERSKEDRRYVTVRLTPKGRETIARVFPKHAKAVAEQFEVLTAREQDVLRSLCRKLGLGKPCER